jgi:hypothetical protein
MMQTRSHSKRKRLHHDNRYQINIELKFQAPERDSTFHGEMFKECLQS